MNKKDSNKNNHDETEEFVVDYDEEVVEDLLVKDKKQKTQRRTP